MKRWWAPILVVSALLGVTLCIILARAHAAPTTLPVWKDLTISKDTTLLTEPLRPDGTVDYITAINQRLGAGVTPENNALVALLPVIGTGPDTLGEQYKNQLAALGGQPAPGMFVAWNLEAHGEGNARIKAWELSKEQHFTLQYTPWKPADSPEFDAWVNANEPSLAIIAQSVNRPHFWMPLVSKDGSLSTANVPSHMTHMGDALAALRMRAMRSLGGGDAVRSWEGLWTAHRLSHLICRDSWVVSVLVGIQSEIATQEGDLALLQCAATDKAVAMRMLSDLQSLPPVPTGMEIIQRKEIYVYPAAVQSMAAGMKKKWDSMTPTDRENMLRSGGVLNLHLPDWDRIACNGVQFDKALFTELGISNTKAFANWRKASRRRLNDMSAAADADIRPGDRGMWGHSDQFFWPRSGETSDDYSDRLARAILSIVTPTPIDTSVERKRLELTPLACALVLYRLDTGAYPTTAEEAAAKYLPAMPTGFWGRPIQYTRTPGGFTLQVLGPGVESSATATKDDLITLEIKRP